MKKKNLSVYLAVIALSLGNCTHEAKETRIPDGAGERAESSTSEQTKQCMGELENFRSFDFARTAVELHSKAIECQANIKQVEEWFKSQERPK